MRNAKGYGWDTERPPSSCEIIVPEILKLVREIKPQRILDLGCGNGALCKELIMGGYEVVGVEPDTVGVKIAKEQSPQAKFYCLGVDEGVEPILMDYPNGFDVVVSTEVIEHLYVPSKLGEFAFKLLSSGGHLIVTTPYHGYLKNLAISIVGGWDKHADPLWDGGHIKLFSRQTITHLLEEAGFSIIRFGGVGRVPYLWKSMVVVAKKK